MLKPCLEFRRAPLSSRGRVTPLSAAKESNPRADDPALALSAVPRIPPRENPATRYGYALGSRERRAWARGRNNINPRWGARRGRRARGPDSRRSFPSFLSPSRGSLGRERGGSHTAIRKSVRHAGKNARPRSRALPETGGWRGGGAYRSAEIRSLCTHNERGY